MSKKKKSSVQLKAEDLGILWDNVMLRPLTEEDDSPLVKPHQYEDKPELGEVIAVGEGRYLPNGDCVPIKFNIGDIVLFNKYSTTKQRINGTDYLFVKAEDVIAYKHKR